MAQAAGPVVRIQARVEIGQQLLHPVTTEALDIVGYQGAPGGVVRGQQGHIGREAVAFGAVGGGLVGHRAEDDFGVLGNVTVGLAAGLGDRNESVNFLPVTGDAHDLSQG